MYHTLAYRNNYYQSRNQMGFIKLANFIGQPAGSSNKKFVNLQYNALFCRANGTNNWSTKRLMFQVLFSFHKILQNSLLNPFQFIFSGTWSMSHLSHRSSEPAYCIVDCRISRHVAKPEVLLFMFTPKHASVISLSDAVVPSCIVICTGML